MTTIRKLSEVRGSVFDLPKSQTLPDDDCNVLLVSSRTLYFIQTFATGEIDFLARYASSFLDGAKYVLAETSSDFDQINDLQNRYEIEVVPVTADLISELQNITLAIQQLAGADCASCGTEVDPEAAPAPTIGPGEDWTTLAAYETYKCEAVNWLLDGIIDTFEKLDAYGAGFWLNTQVATGSALVTAVIATTLFATSFAIIAGAIVAFVVALILGSTIDISNILSVLQTNRDDLTCILFDGADASASKTNFLTELGVLGMNSGEVGLVSALLVFGLVNNLYELNPEIEGHTITSVCTGCGADCALFFMRFSDSTTRGTGNIDKDGASRVLSSVEHPSNGFHYISVNVSLLPDDIGLFLTCAPMAASCVGTNNENFKFNPLSLGGFTDAGSTGTRCISGSHSIIWTGSAPTLGVEYVISFFQFASSTPFTLTCDITQIP